MAKTLGKKPIWIVWGKPKGSFWQIVEVFSTRARADSYAARVVENGDYYTEATVVEEAVTIPMG